MTFDINEYKQYAQAWVMYRDEVLLDEVSNIANLDESRLIEARFTDGSKELHIWRDDDNKLVSYESDISADAIRRGYKLMAHFGKSIELADAIEYDDDGQAYVAHTAFAGFER